MEKNIHTLTEKEIREVYAGAQIDAADDDKVDAKAVKQETFLLNDNPNNEAIVDD